MAFILILCCICEFLQNHPCLALRIAPKGQTLDVSSYHVYLLTGKAGQTDQQFCFMATIYISRPFFGGCCFACSNQHMCYLFRFCSTGWLSSSSVLQIMPPRLSMCGIGQRTWPPLSTALHPLVIGFKFRK